MRLIFFTILFVTALNCQSQNVINNLGDLKSFMNGKQVVDGDVYGKVEGSPYFTDDFQNSEVILQNNRFLKVKMRYDLYKDEVQYISDKDEILIVNLNKVKIESILIGENKFVYKAYAEGKKIKSGLLEILVDGHVQFLKRYEISLKEAKPSNGYQPSEPSRFSSIKTKWYCSVNGKVAVVLKNKKEANKYLLTNVKGYKNKQKVKSWEDLMAEIESFNSEKELK